MLKKIFALALACIALLVFLFYPSNTAGDIVIGGTLYTWQSPLENFQYRRLVASAMDGKTHAFNELANIDCGGGAGCYDHGEVLAHILIQIGDRQFADGVTPLTSNAKASLSTYLMAGFEYGFAESVYPPEIERRFPLTVKALNLRA
jgi:hypothetical protein